MQIHSNLLTIKRRIMISTSDFRNGLKIEYEGEPYIIVEFQHVKPGKGGAFVRTKMKNLRTALVQERNFRSGDKFEIPDIEELEMQYLYNDQQGFHFMDTSTYDQVALGEDLLEDTRPYLVADAVVQMQWFEGKPLAIELPPVVDLKVVETTPSVKDATAQAQRKPATLETGLVVQVPSFIEEGEMIRVSTIDGSYAERVR